MRVIPAGLQSWYQTFMVRILKDNEAFVICPWGLFCSVTQTQTRVKPDPVGKFSMMTVWFPTGAYQGKHRQTNSGWARRCRQIFVDSRRLIHTTRFQLVEQLFLVPSIFRINFSFPWKFKKLGFHCSYGVSLQHPTYLQSYRVSNATLQ